MRTSDFRLAIRSLRRSATFSATSIIILALGIGMSVAMFTTFRALLVQRLPVADQDRLVVLWAVGPTGVEAGGNKLILDALRREARTVTTAAGLAHWGSAEFPLIDGDRSIVLNQAIVESNFFDVLGARPALGRLFRSGDEAAKREGPEQPIVISYQTWQRQFGGDPRVAGRQLINPYTRSRYTVAGVAPPGLDYPAGVNYWVAVARDMELNLITVARLRPGASLAAARSEYFTIARHVDSSWAPELTLSGARVRTLPDEILGTVRPAVVILTAAAVLLLLIACVNVGSLLLLRAAMRGRETAVRRALGASYGDIVRPTLAESLVLGLFGGALGLIAAEGFLRVLLVLAPAELPRLDVVRVGGIPVALAIGTTLIAVLCFGVAPALLAPRFNIEPALRAADRSGGPSGRGRRAREFLVSVQVALALVMITAAGLLAKSLARLERLDLGYRSDHLSFFAISLPEPKYDTLANVFALGEAVLPRLQEIPGVTAVTPVVIPPFIGANVFLAPLELEGATPATNASLPMVALEAAGPDYLRTFGIPIVQGREFSPAEGPGAPAEILVSESAARQFWPGQNPIGKRVHNKYLADSKWLTVVGVVHDLHYRSLREGTPTIFLRWRQYWWQGNIAARTVGDLASVLPAIRRVVSNVDPSVTVVAPESMDAYLEGPLAAPRLETLLMAAFGVVALVLASLGLFGTVASAVRAQTRELGVRMALGATPARVRRGVLLHALLMTVSGAVVGAGLALAGSKLLSAALFEVSPTDPLTIGGAAVLLLTVGLGAAYVPSERATRIDAVQVLRGE